MAKKKAPVATEEPRRLTAERLRSLVSYDESSGKMTWIHGRFAGLQLASNHSAGYLAARIDLKAYLVHRLAWLYVHGDFPTAMLDHINGDRKDNRIANLRECTNAQNCQNVRAHRDGSGMVGASWEKRRNRWQANICAGGRHVFLGYFDTQIEAHLAYLKAKTVHHTFGAQHG